MRWRTPVLITWTLALLSLLTRLPVTAQVRTVYDLGSAGLTQTLQRLQTTSSVLHTGAHPDDEDSAFLARVARGDHARVAYLSLNRGEGGQNIIGTELFDALGVIRTEELLQARRLDGGEQFFTRTFDYGFSKTLKEAAAKWNERDALGDMVRVIRTFRPLVVYSRFSGTPADGHGHHQFAGYLTPLAFKAAADPAEFPEQLKEGLRPWQAKKLYRGVGFRPDPANPATIQVPTGVFDPVLGRSYFEISAEGRSQHKSQEMGQIEMKGPFASGLHLLTSLVHEGAAEASIFDGLDVSVPGLAKLAGLPDGALGTELETLDRAAKQALDQYQPLRPSGILPVLARGLTAARAARQALGSVAGASTDARAEADFLLAIKERDFADALTRAAGVVLDPLSDEETVVPGSSLGVTVRAFVPEGADVKVAGLTVDVPPGWRLDPWGPDTAAAPSGGGPPPRRESPSSVARYRVAVPADAAPTEPYFLTTPRTGDTYRWADGAPRTLPFASPLLTAEASLQIAGVQVATRAPIQFRFADPVRGELRREPNVVPAVTVGLDSRLLIVPLGKSANQQRVVVRAQSHSPRPVVGALRLALPEGWTANPAEAPLDLKNEGDQTSATFMVTAPANRKAGSFDIAARAVVGDAVFASDVQVIAYPHIQTHRIYWPATALAQVIDLKVAPVRVGYIMGSGDQVPDALRRMGVDVTLLDADALATGDLSRYDTVVIGIRASEARPDFVANNGRLLQYVERGGTLVVQYQQGDYVGRGLTPYPAAATTNSRVTDEGAPVRILAPTHPVMTFPNRIEQADFDGWVQERNLYAFTDFDSRYTPLLESADPEEPAQNGAELYAEYGKGRFVYTAYAWFRQLPAGVPGAYRQFANLVSLAKAPR